MIPLSLPQWITVLLLLHLLPVFGIGMYYSIRRYWRLPRNTAHTSIFRCTMCGHVYIENRNVPMAECGRCGHMNESIRNV